MSSKTTQWILELVDKITAPLRAVQTEADKTAEAIEPIDENLKKTTETGSRLPELAARIGAAAFAFNQVSEAVGRLNQQFQSAIEPGARFNSQLADVSAITQKTGDALQEIAGKARSLAKEFGGDASAQLESFKGIIGRFGPDIAESNEALEGMGRNVAVLSKLMGGDAVASMDALTTSMLQYGVDLTDPIGATAEMTRMMNVMVAAGNEGSSEVNDTAEALKQAGLSAKNAHVGFEEVNAALQALATGSIKGSEAGIHLRNVLLKMAGEDVIPQDAREKMAALGVDFKKVSDTTVSFTERLRELKKIQGDATLTAEVFGIANVNTATTLLDTIDMQVDLKDKITGTSAAIEGASIIMDTYNEKVSRTNAWITDLKIGFFNVIEPLAPFITLTGEAMSAVTSMGMAVWSLSLILKKDLWTGILSGIKGIGQFIKATVLGKISTVSFSVIAGGAFTALAGVVSVSCKAISVAIMSIPILGWIAAIVAALIALGAYFYSASAEFRGFLWGMWEAVKVVFTGIGSFISEVLAGVWELIKGVFNPVNWFDRNYNIAVGLSRITNAASKYGESIGRAFAEGKEAGMADFEEGKKQEEPDPADPVATKNPSIGSVPPREGQKKIENSIVYTYKGDKWVKTGTVGKNGRGGGEESMSLSGGGSGSGGRKSITMNVTINITNHGIKNPDEFAEQVVRKINDRLNDSLAQVA
jgi:TP901 family phage tail tape measure protein